MKSNIIQIAIAHTTVRVCKCRQARRQATGERTMRKKKYFLQVNVTRPQSLLCSESGFVYPDLTTPDVYTPICKRKQLIRHETYVLKNRFRWIEEQGRNDR